MQLALNGWPPVASHVTCILVGMSITHLSRSAPPPRSVLAPKTVAFGLAPGLLDRKLPRGSKVRLIKTLPDGGKCHLGEGSTSVVEPGSSIGLTLSSSAAAERDLANVLRAIKERGVTIADAKTSAAIPACHQSAKVMYGSN